MRKALVLVVALPALALAGCSKGGKESGTVTLPRDFKLVSVSADFPVGAEEEFPAGPQADAINNNCRACHSPSMVLVQPPLSHDEWVKVVDKMLHTFKAPVPDSEVPRILEYLDAHSTSERVALGGDAQGNIPAAK